MPLSESDPGSNGVQLAYVTMLSDDRSHLECPPFPSYYTVKVVFISDRRAALGFMA